MMRSLLLSVLLAGSLLGCKSQPRSGAHKAPPGPVATPVRPAPVMDAAVARAVGADASAPVPPPGGWQAALTVVVQTPAGQPVKGIAVRSIGSASPARAVSDDHGEVHFDAAATTLIVVADDPVHPPTTADAELKVGDQQRVVLTLLDGTAVIGTVVDQAGHPIAGAAVEILSLGLILPSPTTSDAAGHFSAVLAEGSWRIKASKPGKSDTWTTLDLPPGHAPAAVTIKLPDAASLLVDTDCASQHCLGASVDVEVENSGFSQGLQPSGRASFEQLPVGPTVVNLHDDSDPRHPVFGEAKVTLLPGVASIAHLATTRLDGSAQITGVLVDAAGKRTRARKGAQLVVEVMFRGFSRRVTAAGDGSFTAANLVPGECELSGLQIDPKDPMSGGNGGRSVQKVVAPASGVKVRVNDFFPQ